MRFNAFYIVLCGFLFGVLFYWIHIEILFIKILYSIWYRFQNFILERLIDSIRPISDNIEIEIGTIHSVKGQTHIATLYLETFYQGKYESEYLKELFLEEAINKNGVYRKQALKMSYVGFSRPTHLLCVAIHKDRFDRDLSEINNEIWEVVELE